MDLKSQLVLLAVFIPVLGVSSWVLDMKSFSKCPEKPNYNQCLLNEPCNPSDENPCGCPHACCAPTKNYFIAEGFSGKRRPSVRANHTLHKINYYCIKKGECNDLCDETSAFARNLNKCGCGKGLTCSFNFWLGQSRCSP